MKPKRIVTALLLVFVAGSVVVLVAKNLRRGSSVEETRSGVIAYYFHGNMRCPTCQNIEQYSLEAIETGFQKQLESGLLEWRVVNYEEPGNEHYASQYDVIAPTVVLVDMRETPPRWKGLDRVWEMIRSEKPEFIEYVQQSTREFLIQRRKESDTRATNESPAHAE